MSPSVSSRRALLALAAASALALTACGGTGEGPGASPPGSDGGGGPSADFLADAPVADDSLFIDGSTMAEIRERGHLVVGASSDAPLMSQKNPVTGEYEGFDAYMGQLLATYIFGEPKVEVVSSATQTREALLQNHTVDVVLQSYSITPERAEQVTFVGPYLSSGFQIATRQDTTDISELADLNGRTVIAGANTPAIARIEEAAPDAEIVTFETDPACVQALLQGRGDAYVQDNIILAGSLETNPELRVGGEPFDPGDMGIGVPKDQEDMAEFVNDWLTTVVEDGSWERVWDASLGSALGDGTPPTVGSVPDVYTGRD
ncbi:glutamate ABC transporter substrate-binding protein [Streptomyces sp. SBT349]|uniref:glutamate ABC transporter substrate-binding protein n=1 Tax=Streptomyces sp. SBT349 TaxID=1580539 RepID=UPI00066E96F5|nr:glutamate ABC transporter substrate-binding protein [Streptomyces sp. SBT349]